MVNHRKDCMVCGKELTYGKTQKLKCFFCNKIHNSKVICKNGHFICDKCHSMSGNKLIEQYCEKFDDFVSLTKNNIIQNKILENLRDTLLPKLLSGEIEKIEINNE